MLVLHVGEKAVPSCRRRRDRTAAWRSAREQVASGEEAMEFLRLYEYDNAWSA